MSPPADRSRRNTLLNIALALVGAALLFVTVRQVGWSDVRSGLAQIGWWFLLTLVLAGLRFAARARAWMVCANAVMRAHTTADAALRSPHSAQRTPHAALRTPHFLGAFLASDALGNLTPLGVLASEPAKILLVRKHLPTVTAMASVAAENAFYLSSVVVMIAAGATVFINSTDLPAGLRLAVQGILVGAVASGFVAVLVARHKPAVLSRLARVVAAVTGRGHSSSDRMQQVEGHFYAILTWRPEEMAHVAAWHALFHVAAVAEVFLVLRLLPGGEATSLADAFVLETTGRLIAVAFKVVPYRLGVDEAGTALVARALALDPTAGVTLALVRRMRILCWNAIGLVVLARSR